MLHRALTSSNRHIMAIPENIAYHQHLLAMQRALLAEYLRQRDMWGQTETPATLRTGIAALQDTILATKATLRSWNIPVDDLSEDAARHDEPADPIAHHQERVTQLRRELALYLTEQAKMGITTSVNTLLAIETIRDHIEATKATLQNLGVEVEAQRIDGADKPKFPKPAVLGQAEEISGKRQLRGKQLGMYSLVMAVFILTLIALIDNTKSSSSLIAVGIGIAFAAFGVYQYARSNN
jgi:hypothetical protein